MDKLLQILDDFNEVVGQVKSLQALQLLDILDLLDLVIV
jgi:hypothetical protein